MKLNISIDLYTVRVLHRFGYPQVFAQTGEKYPPVSGAGRVGHGGNTGLKQSHANVKKKKNMHIFRNTSTKICLYFKLIR